MATITQIMSMILNDQGKISNPYADINTLDDVEDVDISTVAPSDQRVLKKSENKWILSDQVSYDITNYSTKTEVLSEKNTLLGTGSVLSSLEDISKILVSSNDVEETIFLLSNNNKSNFLGDGITSSFDFNHIAGRIDVTVDGVEKTYNISDTDDTSGQNNLTSGYDFSSLDDNNNVINSGKTATKVKFVTAPISNSKIEIRSH